MFDIRQGDALTVLRSLPAASAKVCVTSPPYYRQRDYGTPPVEWPEAEYTLFGREIVVPAGPASLGLEETPDGLIGHLVAIFREVRRVLADDGTLWVNMGDSYAGSWGSQGRQGHGAVAGRSAVAARQIAAAARKESGAGRVNSHGIKAKDLYGMPWWLAFALREDGWYLRQDIIWHKPNPMPESIGDRCTKAHEYVFLLSKSSRYYFDQDAVREPGKGGYCDKPPAGWDTGPGAHGSIMRDPRAGRSSKEFRGGEKRNRSLEQNGLTRGKVNQSCTHPNGKNKRSVWTISTQATPEAHFATFPIDIPEIAILAGSRPGDTVLDPFSGAGTTGLAALKHGRNYLGIELSAEYMRLAEDRAHRIYPLVAAAIAAGGAR